MNDKVMSDTPEQAEFRAHCREWLPNNRHKPFSGKTRTDVHPRISTPEYFRWMQEWQMSAFDGGLIGCDYPKEYGCGGHTDCQRIANEEMQRIGTPPFIGGQGLSLVAPTLLECGSEYLKKRFLAKALSGEEIWCQGFSEPNAGSDVANQETFAEKKGDSWVINGQKVWTSLYEYSDWMILLTRTDRSHKHKGLTYFCVPIKTELGKGVEMRPLIKMTGEAGFAEEFFKDLTVDDKYRLGDEGAGWSVAMTTLKHERGQGHLVLPTAGGWQPVRKDDAKKDKAVPVEPALVALARNSTRHGKSAVDDPVIRDRIMQAMIKQKGFNESNRRTGVKGLVDHPMRIPMESKLVSSEIDQEQSALRMDIEGISAALSRPLESAWYGGASGNAYMTSFAMTIAAGTSEIQRNQLGERILNLPKSK
ncbi:MAG: acyl-CoA dehydrogenase family protein [Desulfobacterales bacterium]